MSWQLKRASKKLEVSKNNALYADLQDNSLLQVLKGVLEHVRDDKIEAEKEMKSDVVNRITNTDKIEGKEKINGGEKEDKAIVDNIIEDISNFSKKIRSSKGNGIMFNTKTITILLSQFTSSLK